MYWPDIQFPPINLLTAPRMNERDKRANSLKLQPRPKQTNSWRHFEMSKPATDIDIVQSERMALCVKLRNRNK